ncbi:hypothetical protein BDP81DRAFT_433890 [Colletotrichum phormii]|uniref:C2H2-type domain-containing protein n=1 Tax=Colletotrichum phormii TaxID=359342 RepID=A0AAJ0EC00_9PEZI|nr:uncharacterized protein BDP81DRAFT_433890 [Colletotrichum phormii]KAK1633504.1 hypothetical protein BDP81DRAFT_433890 [Colletotrichum phormii]
MTLLLRLSSLYSPDTVENRLPTLGTISLGHSAGAAAADTLSNCTPFFDPLLGSLSNSSEVYLAHAQLTSAGISILQTPFDQIGFPFKQYTCSQWLVLEHDDSRLRHGFLNFLVACGTGLYLLKPVAAALLAEWAPANPCYSQSRRPLISEKGSITWFPFKTILERPPIPQLLREWITSIGDRLVQIGARRRIQGNNTARGGSGTVGTSKGVGTKQRGKRDSRPGGSSPPSDTGHTKNDRGGKRPRIDVEAKKKGTQKGKPFACHFYAHNPLAHVNCQHYQFEYVKDVKRHLTEPGRGDHRQPIHCVICYTTFETHQDHVAHTRAQTCSPGHCGFDEYRLDQDKISAITLLRKSRNEEESEFWFNIWDVVFPDEPRPVSPYSGDVEELAIRQRVEPRMAERMRQVGQRYGWSSQLLEEVIGELSSSWAPGPAESLPPVERRSSSHTHPGAQGQSLNTTSQPPTSASNGPATGNQGLPVDLSIALAPHADNLIPQPVTPIASQTDWSSDTINPSMLFLNNNYSMFDNADTGQNQLAYTPSGLEFNTHPQRTNHQGNITYPIASNFNTLYNETQLGHQTTSNFPPARPCQCRGLGKSNACPLHP